MSLAFRAYRMITGGMYIAAAPLWAAYARRSGSQRLINERLGRYPRRFQRRLFHVPRLWLHAVSVGEVNAAFAIISALLKQMPACDVVLSTATAHGMAQAQKLIMDSGWPRQMHTPFAPLDFPQATTHALSVIKPDVLVCLETELWPNWLIDAQRMGARTALINGRISERTVKGYMKMRPLMKAVLRQMQLFSMIQETDARRIRLLGAPAGKVVVNGNAKFDLPPPDNSPNLRRLKAAYNISDDTPVFVAGSIRGKEQAAITKVCDDILSRIPGAVIIVAPRHLHRLGALGDSLTSRRIGWMKHSRLHSHNRPKGVSVVVVDTIGELMDLYGLASVVFCGGSLAPLGGQNVLEPAAWGKPVLYGPSMEDFQEAKNLLETTGGGMMVRSAEHLSERVQFFLLHPQEAERIGKMAKTALTENRGAAQRHAAAISILLKAPSRVH